MWLVSGYSLVALLVVWRVVGVDVVLMGSRDESYETISVVVVLSIEVEKS